MLIELSDQRLLQEIQREFRAEFPFLKLEVFPFKINGNMAGRKTFPLSVSLKQAGLRNAGTLAINPQLTVSQLEDSFLRQFGLTVQVLRRSGMIWLQTTLTDGWTLQNQNEHGREISIA